MNDDPFAAFKEGEAPVEAEKPKNGRKKRNPPADRRGKKKTAEDTPNPPAKRRGKKTRQRRPAKEMRLPISMLLEISITIFVFCCI